MCDQWGRVPPVSTPIFLFFLLSDLGSVRTLLTSKFGSSRHFRFSALLLPDEGLFYVPFFVFLDDPSPPFVMVSILSYLKFSRRHSSPVFFFLLSHLPCRPWYRFPLRALGFIGGFFPRLPDMMRLFPYHPLFLHVSRPFSLIPFPGRQKVSTSFFHFFLPFCFPLLLRAALFPTTFCRRDPASGSVPPG